MNAKKLISLTAVLLLAAFSMADLRTAMQRQFDRYCAAVKSKDAAGIEKVLRDNFSPDFRFIPKRGKTVSLTKWIEDEKKMATMTETVTAVSVHVDSMNMGKGTATMKITLDYEGLTKLDPKGKTGHLKYIATSDQTMVRKNGKWWVTQMKEDTSKATFNGKPMG